MSVSALPSAEVRTTPAVVAAGKKRLAAFAGHSGKQAAGMAHCVGHVALGNPDRAVAERKGGGRVAEERRLDDEGTERNGLEIGMASGRGCSGEISGGILAGFGEATATAAAH